MSRAARALASVLAGSAALAPGTTAPRVRAPLPPRTAPAPIPASQPHVPLASLEERAYRAKPPRPSIHRQAEAAVRACKPYRQTIKAAEKAHKLPAGTLEALLYTESRCRPKAHNRRTNARGLGQHTPGGAAAAGRLQRARGETPWFKHADAFDPAKSIAAAAELLAFGLELCGGPAEALRLYNHGHCGKPGAFSRTVLRLAAALRFVFELEPTS